MYLIVRLNQQFAVTKKVTNLVLTFPFLAKRHV